MKYEAVKRGLRVAKAPGGWAVSHEDSGLYAAQHLRQRRFAEEARTELLATGVDFTKPKEAIRANTIRQLWSPVFLKWRERASAAAGTLHPDLDPVTFEYYPEGTRYGQFIPSASQAAEMRELAAMLRENKRTASGTIDGSVTYLMEFKRMGLVIPDDGVWIWTGAAA